MAKEKAQEQSRESYPIGTMHNVTVRMNGVTPLMQNRVRGLSRDDSSGGLGQSKKKENPTAEQEADSATYRDDDGDCYHPGDAFRSAVIDAVTGTKIGSGKTAKSAPDIFRTSFFVLTERPKLIDPKTQKPLKKYRIDLRPVVNPNTSGAILRARPAWDSWACDVEFEYDPNMLNTDTILQSLNLAGARVGVGELRPLPKKKNKNRGNGGRFGKFKAEIVK